MTKAKQYLITTTWLGTKVWRLNSKLHREDGPAVIRQDGSEEWWLDGKRVDPLVVFLLGNTDIDSG